MANYVEFEYKIVDNGGFKTLAVNANDFGSAVRQVKGEVDDLNGKFFHLSQAAQVFRGLSDLVGQVESAFRGLTAAYGAQSQAETQLAQAMRNTMGASDEEIESVKALAAAQQELGVVGDEVQLAGAQELATYLEFSDSLKGLMPVMNDMIAQQYGMGASAENAAQIASMLGKVMNGQTEALSRYGYRFDEVQKEILNFGTEEERAAVLAQVVGEAVGGMNQALAQTSAGQLQQVANHLGDIREKIGGAITPMMSLLITVSRFGQGAAGIMQLAKSIQALNEMEGIAALKAKGAAMAMRLQSTAARILGVSETAAATATGVLKAQIIALEAAMTLGLSLAITGVVALLSNLVGKSREAADAIGQVDDAGEAYRGTASRVRSELAMETVALEKLIKAKKDTSGKVEELNRKYGEAFGYHKTAAKWYDMLKTKSSEYCRQLGYEAQAKVVAARKAANEIALEEVRARKEAMEKDGLATREVTVSTFDLYGNYSGRTTIVENTREYNELLRQESALVTEIASDDELFQKCTDNAADAANSLSESISVTTAALNENEESVTSARKAMEKAMEMYAGVGKAMEDAATINRLLGQEEKTAADQMSILSNAIRSIAPVLGEESDEVKDLTSRYWELQRAKVAAVMSPGLETIEAPAGKVAASPGSLAQGEKPKGVLEEIETIEQAQAYYAKLERAMSLPGLSDEAREKIRGQMQELEKYYGVMRKVESSSPGWTNAVSALTSAMNDMSGVVGDAAGAWLKWGANLLQAIASAIPQLASLATANTIEATSAGAAAAAEAGKSVASIPYVGAFMAVAAIASVIAALAAFPKFANGGIAYGPTLGLFGEYAGASSNPEVVAPLDRLRSLIGTPDGQDGGRVEFRIRDRELVGFLEKSYNRIQRTR